MKRVHKHRGLHYYISSYRVNASSINFLYLQQQQNVDEMSVTLN